jgi:disulfide bond formation protein DsbB
MRFLSELTLNKSAWFILALSALGLEAMALYFQLVLGLEPCIMCVYQRVAVFALLFAGIVGTLGAQFLLTRILALALWGTGAIWGFLIAKEHVAMQSESFSLFFSCDVVPNFPSWAPLHQWLPTVFEATGDCGKVNWQWFGLSMPEWMTLIFAAYSVVFIIILLARLIHNKMF